MRKARYTFTSRGGGLKLIDLLDYPQTVSARWKNTVSKATTARLVERADDRCRRWRFWAMKVWLATAILR